jgi:hypothetical protein
MKKLYFLAVGVFSFIFSYEQVTYAGGSASAEILNGNILTVTAPIPAVTNFLIITASQFKTNYPLTVLDITTGKTLTLATNVVTSGGSGTAIYYVANPGSGSHTFTITTGGSNANIKVTASFYRNVDISNPVSSAAKNKNLPGDMNNTPGLNIATSNGEMVVDALAYESQITASPGDPSQTNIAYINSHGWNAGASFTSAGASSTNIGWNYAPDAGAYWAVTAISLKPASGFATLPVVLTDFSVQYNKPDVKLQWKTSQEINFSHYSIESSSDGNSFRTVATIAGSALNGGGANYNYTDHSARAGLIYYRLKLVDADGKYSYSSVKIIRISEESLVQVKTFPNPVQSSLMMTMPSAWQDKNVSVSVYSVAGVSVINASYEHAGQTETIDVNRLQKGSYVLRLTCNGAVQQSKIIRN